MAREISVLMITVEWPDTNRPNAVPFLVRDVNLLRNQNIKVDVFPFRGAKNPINYIKAALAIRKKLRLAKYDLIHAQWGQSVVPVLLSGLPLVTTFRGSDLFGITDADGKYTWTGKILKWVSKIVALRSDCAILVSKRMVPLLPAKTKYVVLPGRINLKLFKPGSKGEARQKLKIELNAKVILFGGDPSREDKRFYLARQAVEMVSKELPVQLLTASNVSQSEMPAYYQAADLLLLTSKHEGSPNMVKEALACNTPVVSVDVGDVRERIHNIPGCIVCENDLPLTIARALKAAIVFDNREVSLRDFVLDLDENLFAEKLIAIYKKAISKE